MGHTKLTISNYLSLHIILPTILLIVIPLILLVFHINNRFVLERVIVMSQTLDVIEDTINEHQDYMIKNYGLAKEIVQRVDDYQDKKTVLSNFVVSDSERLSFFEVDDRGRILASYPENPLTNGTVLPVWQADMYISDGLAFSAPFKDDMSGRVVMFLMPDKKTEKNLVMSFTIDLNRYLENIRGRKLRLFIYHEDQLLLKSSEDIMNEGIGSVGAQYEFPVDSQTILLKETVYLGKRSVFIDHKMDRYHWTLVTLTDKAAIYGSQQLIAIICLSIILLFSFTYGLFITGLNRQVLRPLKYLGDYFNQYDVKVKNLILHEAGKSSSLIEFEAVYDGIKVLNQEIESTYQELYEFVSIAAHDLNEPLRTITSYLDILKSDYLQAIPDEGNEYIEHIFKASKRSQILIEALLSYATLNRSLVLETFEMSLSVQEVVANLMANILKKEAVVLIAPLPKVIADKSLFERLLQNLLSNSLKYANQNVKIEIYMEGQSLCFKDNGIGFDIQYAHQIFKPLKRLHTSEEYPGTGIGLSMVAKIVEKHQWHIEVASEVGKGTIFSILLDESIVKD